MSDECVYHICLAGRKVSSDPGLLRALKSKFLVSLAPSVRLLSLSPVLNTANVLVLDCTESFEVAIRLLIQLKKKSESPFVVLVDGKLTQRQVATAFNHGAKDYFSDPYEVQLLAERVCGLAQRAKTARKQHE